MKIVFATLCSAAVLTSCAATPTKSIPANDIPPNGVLVVHVDGPKAFRVAGSRYSARELDNALGKLSHGTSLKEVKFIIKPALMTQDPNFDCGLLGVMSQAYERVEWRSYTSAPNGKLVQTQCSGIIPAC